MGFNCRLAGRRRHRSGLVGLFFLVWHGRRYGRARREILFRLCAFRQRSWQQRSCTGCGQFLCRPPAVQQAFVVKGDRGR